MVVEFYQHADTTVWISIAFGPNVIDRLSTAADQLTYPVAWDTYRQFCNAGQIPTAMETADTQTTDPQAEETDTLQPGDAIP